MVLSDEKLKALSLTSLVRARLLNSNGQLWHQANWKLKHARKALVVTGSSPHDSTCNDVHDIACGAEDSECDFLRADEDEEAPGTAERAQRLEQARQLLLDQPLSRRRNNMFEDEVSLALKQPPKC